METKINKNFDLKFLPKNNLITDPRHRIQNQVHIHKIEIWNHIYMVNKRDTETEIDEMREIEIYPAGFPREVDVVINIDVTGQP